MSVSDDNLVAERGAFTFSADSGEEIKEVPFVYSPNLMMAIAELVDKHNRCLTIRIYMHTILHVASYQVFRLNLA